jgi:hypothetical protein
LLRAMKKAQYFHPLCFSVDAIDQQKCSAWNDQFPRSVKTAAASCLGVIGEHFGLVSDDIIQCDCSLWILSEDVPDLTFPIQKSLL